MANWIPKNKKTGVEYPPIDDAVKAAMLADPLLKGKYTFKQTDAPAQKKEAVPKPTKKSLAPIGVDSPETEKEEEIMG